MATHEFEKIIAKACDDLEIPGAVLLATNRDGSFTYSKAFGRATIGEDGGNKPMQLNTVMYIGSHNPASCTKLLTSLAALHLASSKNLSLDDPDLIKTHIPELTTRTIIESIGEDGRPPHEIPHTKSITLRQFLTHTSGLVYDPMSPLTLDWVRAHNKEPLRSGIVTLRYDSPLIFEPGTSWMYGPSLDYAGLLIERVSGVTLEEYMKTHLWAQLGIKDMVFHISTRPDMKERLADIGYRTAEGKVSATPESPQRLMHVTPEGDEVEGFFGGDGIFTSPEEYMKVLRGVLDMSIIPPDYVDDFFSPQLDKVQADAMNDLLQIDQANNVMGCTNKEVRKNWGLGGLLLDADDHAGGRKEGTMIWAGMPMLSWFVDRKADVCGLFATQVLPTGDQRAAELTKAFIDGVYALLPSDKEPSSRL